MGKRPASSKATRGASKGKKVISSSSNPKTKKFRSQYNSLAVIARGGPSKKAQNKEALKTITKSAVDRQKLVSSLDGFSVVELGASTKKTKSGKNRDSSASVASDGSRLTSASFASVWSNCTNSSLVEFFNVWNPKLEPHKDALSVIAALSQTMSKSGTDQTDGEFTRFLIKIISSKETPANVLTGALLALTFVMRKLSTEAINTNFDEYYKTLKDLMERYNESKRRTLIKCLLRCFSCLSKAHPSGKAAFESSVRKKLHIALRRLKIQNKINL